MKNSCVTGHRVTQHFMDALGRETNTVVGISLLPPGSFTNSAAQLHSPLSTATEYPCGTSNYRVTTSPGGVQTITQTTHGTTNGMDCTLTTATVSPGSAGGSPAGVVTTVHTSYRNGPTATRREWDGKWTEETTSAAYDSSGNRTVTTTRQSSDTPGAPSTSSATYDFAGRPVSTETPLGVTSNYYAEGTTRLIATTRRGAGVPPIITEYLYDACGSQCGTVQNGVTNLTLTTYELIDGQWWRVTTAITATPGSAGGSPAQIVTVTKEQLTGLSDALRSRTITIAPDGTANVTETSFNPDTHDLTTTSQTDGQSPIVTVSRYGYTLSVSNATTATTYAYDGLGRRVAQVFSVAQPVSGVTTTYAYDALSRLAAVTTMTNNSEVTTTAYSYDCFNRVTQEDVLDSNNYKLKTKNYSYDSLGNVTAVGGDGAYPVQYAYDASNRKTAMRTTRDDGITLDETLWLYDHATGLLTNKVFADGTSQVYTHDGLGRPATSTDARGVVIHYGYDEYGNLSETFDYHYGDESRFERDALGNLLQVYGWSWGNPFSYSYANSTLGIATNENVQTPWGYDYTITRTLDGRSRVAVLGAPNTSSAYYGYDSEGRLASVSNTAFTATYLYTPSGMDAGYTITLPNSNIIRRDVVRDVSGNILSITNTFNGNPLSCFGYTHDALGRAVKRNADSFAYNNRSEVTNAMVAAASLPSAYSYAYDTIGNRQQTTVNAASTPYSANNLNQYTGVGGVSPLYDLNGNMTFDGRFAYTWDSQNRLTSVASNGVTIADYYYDHLGRRTAKYTDTAHDYVYDGWNLVCEATPYAPLSTPTYYIWGKDLSGTFHGAGGVGGLLAVNTGGAWYFPLYDANGNVTEYVDENGVVVAHYEYDAFGNTLVKTGAMADTFKFRFSTKYWDEETGKYYYGKRYTDPLVGRFLSQDPIAERGGLNLYAFCVNDPVNKWDYLGMDTNDSYGKLGNPEKFINIVSRTARYKKQFWRYAGWPWGFEAASWNDPWENVPITSGQTISRSRQGCINLQSIEYTVEPPGGTGAFNNQGDPNDPYHLWDGRIISTTYGDRNEFRYKVFVEFSGTGNDNYSYSEERKELWIIVFNMGGVRTWKTSHAHTVVHRPKLGALNVKFFVTILTTDITGMEGVSNANSTYLIKEESYKIVN